MITKTIAITGAGGFLGSNLVTYFAAQGWQVVALVRRPKNFKNTQNTQYRYYDLTKDVNQNALKGVDYLVHAAYVKEFCGKKEAFEQNISGAKKLIQASRVSGIKRSIFISSMSSHNSATSSYGKQKYRIEQLFNTSNDLNLRLGLIIGDGGIVKDMINFIKSKRIVPVIGNGQQPLQTINVTDVGPAAEAAISKRISGTLTLAHPEIHTYKEFYRELTAKIDIKVLYVRIPYVLFLFLLAALEILGLHLSISADSLRGLKKLKSTDNKNDIAILGIQLDDLITSLAKTKI